MISSKLVRRALVALTLSVCSAKIAIFSGVAIAETNAARIGFHFKQIDDKSLGLWEGDRPVMVYNFGQMSLPEVRAAGTRSSYVHPIYGLDGEVLTDDFPADHYHHHGLFWGWPHVSIGGREYDLWKMRGIRIDFQSWLAKEATRDGAKLGIENGWFVRDKHVMKEQVLIDVSPATGGGRNIDVTLSWTPLDQPITLVGAEGKSYGGVTLRFAPRKGTIITTPNGRATDDLLMARLPWADLSAQFKGASSTSGAAVLVDPQNPDFPPEWMTREYGVLAIGWPGIKSLTLAPGRVVTCRYRIWIHRGTPDAAEVRNLYDAYQRSRQSK